MNSHRYIWVVIVAVIVVTTACSSSPAQPSGSGSGSGTTASIVAPTPLTPANNAPVANAAQPVTLAARNAVSTQTGALTYTFEVATDSTFTSKVQTKDAVPEGSGGQTSVRLDALAAARDYYWHVRAQGGGTTGVFGSTFKFTVGAAIAISAPPLVAPANGATTSGWPAFVVANALKTGPVGAIRYRFEIATNAGFTAIVVTSTVDEGFNQTSFLPSSGSVPPAQTLFWRVTAIDQSSGTSSAPGTVQSFTPVNTTQSYLASLAGFTLWPGQQPTGSNGQAILGDNWDVQTLHHLPTNTFFRSPTGEMLRFFDLFDRGFDPQSAIDWLNGHGYSTSAQWYPPPEKAVLGLDFVYLAARDKVLVHGIWDLVLKIE